MAIMMMNAANMAYQKAIKKTRDKEYLAQNHPVWMQYFAENLPEKVEARPGLAETKRHRKKRLLAHSEKLYNRIAWFVYSRITSQVWFEVVILINILCIGAATGLDLENDGDKSFSVLVTTVSIVTTTVFTLEVICKVVAEGYEPLVYFTDPENGKFNTLDFSIVMAGYIFMGMESGGAIGVLRMLRLVRLLTFIKGVPQLRAIIAGLVKGMQSVTYIVMLLVLIIYLFAIMGVLFFGANDPARFGSVAAAMITLFQVSTLASWTSIAYTSWYGCGNYNGDPYAAAMDDDPASVIHTSAGILQGFKCGQTEGKPISTFLFFSIFVIISAWVIMSLFIGVISMGMFEAFEDMKGRQKEQRYRERLEENQQVEEEEDLTPGSKMKGEKLSLKQKIDIALENKHRVYIPASQFERNFLKCQQLCIQIRDDARFSTLIVVTIVLVGVMIGVDTDQLMHCVRYDWRVRNKEDDDHSSWCGSLTISMVVGYMAQAIFTFEAIIKILAEGFNPERYFNDRQNGSWNKLDFFIVIVGFLEMSPIKFIFEAFPVVVLRLLRLMRVFRLAKALPRLRSIVDALLSGFGSVGWICMLMVVFNYIAGCMCMLCFRKNDPVHFGSVGRSMFTVFRIETLDSWDQVLYIAMYGCEKYPAGYPLLNNHGSSQCEHSNGTGYLGAAVFFVVVILGAYVMPTVLIGIVSINFDEANRRAEAMQEMDEKMERIAIHAKSVNPLFFTDERFIAIRTVFDSMDADGELTLDVNEMAPFYQYVFDKLFGVDLDQNQTEALFHLMDMDGDTELGFAEFVLFIVVIKNIENKCREDPAFALQAFPPDQVRRTTGLNKAETWKKAMEHMDEEAIDEAWKRILHYLNASNGDEMYKRVQELFLNFDSDRDNAVDLEELGHGLTSLGILVNSRQIKAFSIGTDTNQDGCISFEEFYDQVKLRAKIIQKREEQKAMEEAQALLKRVGEIASLKPGLKAEFKKASESFKKGETKASNQVSGSIDGEETKDALSNEDNDGKRNKAMVAVRSTSSALEETSAKNIIRKNNKEGEQLALNDIVTQCARRIAKRFLGESYKRLPAGGGDRNIDEEIEALSRKIADRVVVEFAWFGASVAKPTNDEFVDLVRRTVNSSSNQDQDQVVMSASRLPTKRPCTPPLSSVPTGMAPSLDRTATNMSSSNQHEGGSPNGTPLGSMSGIGLFSEIRQHQNEASKIRTSRDLAMEAGEEGGGGIGGFFSSFVSGSTPTRDRPLPPAAALAVPPSHQPDRGTEMVSLPSQEQQSYFGESVQSHVQPPQYLGSNDSQYSQSSFDSRSRSRDPGVTSAPFHQHAQSRYSSLERPPPSSSQSQQYSQPPQYQQQYQQPPQYYQQQQQQQQYHQAPPQQVQYQQAYPAVQQHQMQQPAYQPTNRINGNVNSFESIQSDYSNQGHHI